MGGAESRFAYTPSNVPADTVAAPHIKRYPASVDLRSSLTPHTVRKEHDVSVALAVVSAFLSECDLNSIDVMVPSVHALSALTDPNGEGGNIIDAVTALNKGVPAEDAFNDTDDVMDADAYEGDPCNANITTTALRLKSLDEKSIMSWLASQRCVLAVLNVTQDTVEQEEWCTSGDAAGMVAGVIVGYNKYDNAFLFLEASVTAAGLLMVPFRDIEFFSEAYVLDVSTVDDGPLFVGASE